MHCMNDVCDVARYASVEEVVHYMDQQQLLLQPKRKDVDNDDAGDNDDDGDEHDGGDPLLYVFDADVLQKHFNGMYKAPDALTEIYGPFPQAHQLFIGSVRACTSTTVHCIVL